jgi:hypothetical protein
VRHLTLTTETELRQDSEAPAVVRGHVLRAGRTRKAGAANTRTSVVPSTLGPHDEGRDRSPLHLHPGQPRLGR